ncbi:alpha-galactosidase, partial [Bacillus sp. SIMBA_005]|uniref:alpha-galactosidase n=1 Tax=Bacillus sp. SIMBA_005 TaxID=3085754 RepID=UPI00397C905C
PEWILAPKAGVGLPARNQYVLDLTNPAAFEHVRDAISDLVSRYDIDFIKWDHNRDLLEAVTRGTDPQRPAVHAQTLALYRLLDELGGRFPSLEIETCSAGGGRVDLGILERT